MSVPALRPRSPARRRFGSTNMMVFPRALRDAIPDLPTYSGRVLEIDSVDGHASNSALFGPRVQLKVMVKETGKLTGKFAVQIYLEPEAARGLAARLSELADQAGER